MKTFLKDQSKSPEKRPQKKQNPSLWKFKVLLYPRAHNGLLKAEEFQEVTEVKGRAMVFLQHSCVFHSKEIEQKLNKKNPQIQHPISGDTRSAPKPDSLCGHHLGDTIQEFQAMQDPVAEPWAAGIQTL